MKRNTFLRYGYSIFYPLIGNNFLLLYGCRKEETPNNPLSTDTLESNDVFKTPLPIPKEVTGGLLTAQHTYTSIVSGINTRVLGYHAGAVLGPTLSLQEGDDFNISFVNRLQEDSNVHWHGLTPPAHMDGHPLDQVAPGKSFNYQFKITNRAGTYWYHAHPMHKTASQVYEGLAGMFFVRNSLEKELNLPELKNEIPLVIQDKKEIINSLTYSVNHHETMWGIMGDFNCVNGILRPFHKVDTSTYRLRILNGSNARIYDLAFSNNISFHLIGADCGLLEQSYELNSLTLAPAERADILVSFKNQKKNTAVYLLDKNNNDRKLIKFFIHQEKKDDFVVPKKLSTIERLNPSMAVRERIFILSNHGMMGMNNMHTINGKSYDPNRIDEVVKAGSVEIWEFDNSFGVFDHPMHLHGVQFQVMERKGGRNQIIPSETGLKDTFLVKAREIVKVIIQFGNHKGKYVFHCHNLEHENEGMMLQYKIT